MLILFYLLSYITSSAIWPEQAVDGGGAAVDASQHFAGLAAQVPAQGEGVQVGKETQLNHAVGVLLHPDPQESAHVADKPRGAWEMEKTVTKATERGWKSTRGVAWRIFVSVDIVHPGVGPTCPAALHELEQDVNTHCSSQSLPTAAISQFIHCERDKYMKVNETIGLKMWQINIIKKRVSQFESKYSTHQYSCSKWVQRH